MSVEVKGRDRLVGIGTPVVLLGLWEFAAYFGLLDTRFFPPPSAIVHQFAALIASGELGANIMASLKRLGLGMLLGGIPALLLGLAMGISRPLRAAIDPLISATYPIPKSAILPLVLLIFGLGEMSKVVMVALGAFYPIVINTVVGVANIDKIYLDVGQNYRANRWQVFRTIALPGALPAIMAGVKLAVGMGLILIAISEMVAASDGIGYMIWNAWQVLTVDTMYVGLLVIAVLGFLFSVILDEIEHRLIPWKSRA
ncbi:ABC transporter permease [Bradyrhizobium zhanjiangense]|uniref:ABC transporter permease n=1 Tax=Bradyrhizobium zhanjiangense TaxID=1325107 RepID=A0ABY0DTN4_9BRAD|nr:ABC transporter permease [Bradyrhizobium zhanjiangense]RXH00011.1 ABC transporter permease [Bradyrhizobium zhanjiangense]